MPWGRVPGPIGLTFLSGQLATSLLPLGHGVPVPVAPTLSYHEFRDRVLAAAIQERIAQGRVYFPAVPTNELAKVEGEQLRIEAAASCTQLLQAVRRDLAIQQMGPPTSEEAKRQQEVAREVSHIGISSAYGTTKKSGAFGRKIAFPRKAPPGFSNHSDGRAVDFVTTQAGIRYGASTPQRAAWRRTWLHAWLLRHAAEYRFHHWHPKNGTGTIARRRSHGWFREGTNPHQGLDPQRFRQRDRRTSRLSMRASERTGAARDRRTGAAPRQQLGLGDESGLRYRASHRSAGILGCH